MTTFETYKIADGAPGGVECEVRVVVYPPYLRVQEGPEVILKLVRFADRIEAENDGDYSRLVHARGDKQWIEHLPWPDLQQRCRERYGKGEKYFGATFEVVCRNCAQWISGYALTCPKCGHKPEITE